MISSSGQDLSVHSCSWCFQPKSVSPKYTEQHTFQDTQAMCEEQRQHVYIKITMQKCKMKMSVEIVKLLVFVMGHMTFLQTRKDAHGETLSQHYTKAEFSSFMCPNQWVSGHVSCRYQLFTCVHLKRFLCTWLNKGAFT